MKPIKFEEKMKEYLRARKVQPSDQAWERLGALLDTGEQRKERNRRDYGVAAAAVFGVLLLSIWYFGTSESQLQPIVIRNTEISLPETEVVSEQAAPSLLSGQLPQVLEENTQVVYLERSAKQKLVKQQAQSQLLGLENKESGSRIVAQSQPIVKFHIDNYREEADSLLFAAQQKLTAESNNGTVYRIDSNELLIEAESELDHSFREQVLDKLKNGYKKVKTALADRNN